MVLRVFNIIIVTLFACYFIGSLNKEVSQIRVKILFVTLQLIILIYYTFIAKLRQQ